jgi:hypothetical protein
MSGHITTMKHIFRADVRQRRDTAIFVFGDNMVRWGNGGQAYAMRGEPNAIGIPTKWNPKRTPDAFFRDEDWVNSPAIKLAIDDAFARIEVALKDGLDVVVPEDGIGTGLAELTVRAPVIFKYIHDRLAKLRETYP